MIYYAFKQLCQVLSVEHYRIAYFAYVQGSLFQKGILVWEDASSTVLESLVIFQKAIIKFIFDKTMRYFSKIIFSSFNNILQLYLKTPLMQIKIKCLWNMYICTSVQDKRQASFVFQSYQILFKDQIFQFTIFCNLISKPL